MSWQNPSQPEKRPVSADGKGLPRQAGWPESRKGNQSVKLHPICTQTPMCCKRQAYRKELLDMEQKPVR